MTPGIIEVGNGTYRGVLRDENGKITWQCDHIHSKPELNVRWSKDDSRPWEISAKNCAIAAKMQQNKVGDHGAIANDGLRDDERDDTKRVKVGDVLFVGKLNVSHSGNRWIHVSSEETGSGHLNINRPSRSAIPANDSRDDLKEWATAALYFRKSIWGTKFRDPNELETISVGSFSISEIDHILSSPEPAQVTNSEETYGERVEDETPDEVKPHIRVADYAHKTYYEVINRKGEVAGKYVHRGEAAKRLKRVKSR